MGIKSSKTNPSSEVNYEDLKRRAMKNLTIRLNMYKYTIHGVHLDYVKLCRARYELECITPSCLKGPNYKP
jgi:hypothetical protein